MRATELFEADTDKLKHGSTKGHLAEYLLGASVVAKMVKGAKPVTREDAISVMQKTSATENLSEKFIGSEGDEIQFTNIIKNAKNIADAKDVDALVAVMGAELDGAVKFANSDVASAKWSKIFAENGKPDQIIVKAAGEEDQKGTKADIFLMYAMPNGENKIIKGWSLKAGSDLIGQASPRTFDNMVVFFKELGITLKPIDNWSEDPKKHVASVMQQVADDLNGFTMGDNDDKESQLVTNVVNFMSEHIAKKDHRVYIVNILKGDYSAQTVRKMHRNLTQVDLESSVKPGGQPTVLVHEKGNPKNLLFKVRYTYSPGKVRDDGSSRAERHRLFVETGVLFKKLGTVSIKDTQLDESKNV
tara:strand:- start:23451 stop:24527 length:1077 start_codon:yes stop_codon:yes gene_type:complete